MTMRVTIENVDESGRVLEVRQEDRPADKHQWDHTETVSLAKGQKRDWYIHAARRLIVTENPNG